MGPVPSTSDRIRILGPKDWVPMGPLPSPGFGTDFLVPEDRERLNQIYGKAVAGDAVTPEEVIWLSRALNHAATLRRMDDYLFPKYVCLINGMSGTAMALGFPKRVTHLVRETAVLGAGDLLHQVVECDVCTAVFMVRPVVEILKADPVDREKFLSSRMRMYVGHVAVIDDTFLGHTLPLEGRAPFTFGSELPAKTENGLYGVSPLTDQNEADGRYNLGLFVPNGTDLRIEAVISGSFRDPVVVRTKILGALYTTKGPGASFGVRLLGPT
jgi:hypothetical protein